MRDCNAYNVSASQRMANDSFVQFEIYFPDDKMMFPLPKSISVDSKVQCDCCESKIGNYAAIFWLVPQIWSNVRYVCRRSKRIHKQLQVHISNPYRQCAIHINSKEFAKEARTKKKNIHHTRPKSNCSKVATRWVNSIVPEHEKTKIIMRRSQLKHGHAVSDSISSHRIFLRPTQIRSVELAKFLHR